MKARRIILVVVLISVVIFWLIFEYFIDLPIVTQNDVHYFLHSGATTRDIARDLNQLTDLFHPLVFRLAARIHHVDEHLQAGEYIFPRGSSIHNILTILSQGKVVYYNFTLVDGWTFRQVMASLNQSANIQHLLTHLTEKQIAEKLNLSQQTPEGWLFPETYRYIRGDSDLHLLKQAHALMQEKLNIAWQTRAEGLWYRQPYQALIVASMIEKESAVLSEKPLIAAVILRRLKEWIPLQIDATVIYGLGLQYQGKLTKQDLQKKTPYNTYTKYGLPPTPISMPGESSLQAALQPAETRALYFVAKGDGTHLFSENLAEQDKNIDQYQLHRGKEQIKSYQRRKKA